MERRKQTRGKCAYCGRDLTRTGMTRHLQACPERTKAINAAIQERGANQPIYHLLVKDSWSGSYWLHLEMNGRSRLVDLDDYLRAIWLECCGHLSHFAVGNDAWRGQEMPMSRSVAHLFQPGVELTHIYDYGTSSITRVKVVDVRRGKPLTHHPIALMARNDPLVIPCQECGEPASWLCMECVIEHDKMGALCDTHVEDHPHDDYGPPGPLWNSPRVGLCGYDGPAEPPY